jgi:predicted nucleic acid-binding protein
MDERRAALVVCVIDNSWAAAYFMPDEDAAGVNDFFENLGADDKIFMPSLIWTEFSNVLKTAIRRKRITKEKAGQVLTKFAAYSFETVSDYGLEYSQNVFNTACLYDLTSYDAAYLELAMRKNAALATLDDGLKAAAVKARVEVK